MDIELFHSGRIVLLHPKSEDGIHWIENHMDDLKISWLEDADKEIVDALCTSKDIDDLKALIQADGLEAR